MNEVNQTGQLALFSAGSVIDEEISRVFGPKDIKNAKGMRVGSVVGIRTRKEIAEVLQLKGKDNKEALDKAILGQSDAAWLKVKGAIAALNGDWTLKRFANRTLGNGVEQITVVTQRISRAKPGPTNEEIAKMLGISVDEVIALRAEQAKRDQVTDLPAATAAKEVAS